MLKKVFVFFLIISSILSCTRENFDSLTSVSEATNQVEDLGFFVFGDYYETNVSNTQITEYYQNITKKQINVSANREVTEYDIVSEFGLDPKYGASLYYNFTNNYIYLLGTKEFKYKNFYTNEVVTRQMDGLCGIPLQYKPGKVVETENRFVFVFYDGSNNTNSKYIVSINKNFDTSSCKAFFVEDLLIYFDHNFYSNSKYVMFKGEHYNGLGGYTNDLYCYNAETNKLKSVSSSDLLLDTSGFEIVLDQDKFYLFTGTGRNYKTFDFDFNFLGEKETINMFINYGAKIIDNKIVVSEVFPNIGGFSSTPNVYDFSTGSLLIEKDLQWLLFTDTTMYQLLNIDLKRKRIFFGGRISESPHTKGNIIIMDFNMKILEQIEVNVIPKYIHVF